MGYFFSLKLVIDSCFIFVEVYLLFIYINVRFYFDRLLLVFFKILFKIILVILEKKNFGIYSLV